MIEKEEKTKRTLLRSVFIAAGLSLLAVSAAVMSGGCTQRQSEYEGDSFAQESSFEEETQTSFQPFVVYEDKGSRQNHYVPSGFMPDGQCVQLQDDWEEGCHSGNTCIRIVYDTDCSKKGQKWAGVYWLHPANNWGQRKGGYDLTGAKALVFWAKGEKGGERIEEFKVGGVTGNYPDSDSAMIGPVILENTWREYRIDLRGKDLSSIIGGFAWVTNTDVNAAGPVIFYLDDIHYE